jgi:xanthine dehydrogenase YagR molybdenum-binding subunit
LPATRNLADYHVPTNLDIPEIDVQFVGEPDFEFNPVGCRGMGEIGITGVAPAVANAVYHATGKRVRNLPITLDKLICENGDVCAFWAITSRRGACAPQTITLAAFPA